ncbi:MAG: ClpXP protease specificity-enhancing factor SspB [Polyangiales bacterium]
MPFDTDVPPKRDVAVELMKKGSVYLHLDPRQKHVRVPKWLRHDPQLVLQVGFDMPIPIPDLVIDEAGVSATLSFQRSPHYCHIPWDAVFAVVGEEGRGMLWPEDLPEELFREVAKEAARGGGFEGILDDFEDDVALDAPSEVRSQIASRPLRLVPVDEPASVDAPSRRPRARRGAAAEASVVDQANPVDEANAALRTVPSSRPSAPSESSKPRAPHLRLVK